MTRRSDRPTARRIAETLEGLDLQARAARGELTDEDRARAAAARPRKRVTRRVQHERMMQEALSETVLRTRWYAPGYTHHRNETWGQREAWAGWRAGVQPGWPDVTLIIPRLYVDGSEPRPSDGRDWRATTGPGRCHWWDAWECSPTCAALELKHGKNTLTADQARKLRDMECAGWAVEVIWDDWKAALAWLDEQAGPRPAVLPEGWGEL